MPRAIWIALLSVGGLVILNAFATTLAHPDPAAVAAGKDIDPVSTAVATAFGDWSSKPFAGSCSSPSSPAAWPPRARPRAASTPWRATACCRARGCCAASTAARRRSEGSSRSPLIAWSGLLLGLEATAIGSLITFGTAAIFVSFLLTAVGALIGRTQGMLSRSGMLVNVLAVAWLAFETVNIAWPRESLAPVGAPWYQLWAAPMVVAAITVIGLAYLLLAKPAHRTTS